MLGTGHALIGFPHAGSGVLGVIRSLRDFENFIRKSNTFRNSSYFKYFISQHSRGKSLAFVYTYRMIFALLAPNRLIKKIEFTVLESWNRRLVNSFWEWVWDQVVQYIFISARRNFFVGEGEARSTRGGLVGGHGVRGSGGQSLPDAGEVFKNFLKFYRIFRKIWTKI